MATKRPRGRPKSVNRWKYLCELMEAAGWKDKQLAEAVGVGRATVGKWRRGEQVPWDEAIPVIANALNGDADRLRADAPFKSGRKDKYRAHYKIM